MNTLKNLGIKPINLGSSVGENEWLGDNRGELLNSLNPATEELIAKVLLCTDAEYETVLETAKMQSLIWRRVPAPKRGELVRQIAEILREKKDALGTLVAMEMGKSKAEGDGEVQEMIDIADFAVGQARMLYGKTMHSERIEHRMYEQWHPLGVVGVISAFNFPVAVWAWNAFIAAIAGNTVVWKPSSKVPLCAIAVQHICNEVMHREGYRGIFSLFIPASPDLAEKFVADSRVDLLSFTGSTRVGRHVAEVVARRLGRSLLELGGNNAVIIDETANLQLAVPAIVFGAIGTAGQRCTSTRRLIVHESRYEELLKRLRQAYQQISVGNPLDLKNNMGPLIDSDAVQAYQTAIDTIKQMGGEIAFGGRVLKGKGYYVEPTLVIAKPNWPIVQQETFAPILYVMKYENWSEAITWHNGVAQGLSSALFTDSLRQAERFLSAQGSDCGIANINVGTSGAEVGGAFGGEKETGGGREAGSDAWQSYMRRQTTTINWGASLPLAQGIKF